MLGQPTEMHIFFSGPAAPRVREWMIEGGKDGYEGGKSEGWQERGKVGKEGRGMNRKISLKSCHFLDFNSDPDSLIHETDPRIWIQIKMKRIRNTVKKTK